MFAILRQISTLVPPVDNRYGMRNHILDLRFMPGYRNFFLFFHLLVLKLFQSCHNFLTEMTWCKT